MMKQQFTKRFLCLVLIAALTLCVLPAQADYRTLKEGDSGKDVLAFKTALYYLGYFTSLNMSNAYNKVTTERVKNLQRMNGLEETGIADPALQELVFSGQAVPTAGAPAPTPVPSPAPTPLAPGELPADIPDVAGEDEEYVYSDAEEGLWIYKSAALEVVIRRYTDTANAVTWFESEVKCSPEAPLTTYLSEGKNPGRKYINPITLAKQHGAVLALTDDFFGSRIHNKETVGVIVRNGQVIWDKTYPADKPRFPNLEVLAVHADGSLKTYLSNAYTAQQYIDMGVTDTFAFGPILVQDGQPGPHMGDATYYHYREPRCAIGMIAPYHYIILTVKGRTKDSKGVYMDWLADKMLEKGAVEAINLDGGGTVALIFMGAIINATGKNMRSVTSIIGFGNSENTGAGK